MQKIMSCVDCFDAVNFTDEELGYIEGTLAATLNLIDSIWGLTGPYRIHNEHEGSDEDFSTTRCQTCGSDMAGARYAMTIIEENP